MKIRLTALLLALLMLICMPSALANGCSEGRHTVVVDPAVAPTCTTSGLTQGSHCSVCHVTIVRQQVVKMTNHEYYKAAVYWGEGKHSHKCKHCSGTWRVHCTLLDQNDCVTCHYVYPTVIITEENAADKQSFIDAGDPLLLLCPEAADDAVARFSFTQYEYGQIVPYVMEAVVRLPLTEEQQALVTDASRLVFHGEEEDAALEYELVDGVLTFRTALRGTFELLAE